ncbi:MAG TPA: ABC transporter permease [Kiritimatiellia bacterium]|nr:ABC transporter permease [Kiritimatiellia bacterium]HSA19742.1 ABC transporter permease [Kiritimatiellia bacterium]
MNVRVAMRFWVRDLWEGIRSEPGRVGLSFLAVAIGFTALTLLLAVLDGLRARAQDLVRDLGANVIAVVAEPQGRDAAPVLSRRQADRLAGQLPECRCSALRRYDVRLPGDKRTSVTVLATDERLLPLRGWALEAGRNLDRRDVEEGARHIVASSALARRWGAGVGGLVSLEQVSFRIVGIMSVGGAGLEQEEGHSRLQAGELAVLVPYSAPIAWGDETPESAGRADAVFIQVPPGRAPEDLLPVARNLLEAAGVSWITPEVLLRGVRRWQQAVRLAGGSIALLCLVLGGTTLMSLMVANVRDRMNEIGLRRALGATPADVARLFTAEACLVTGLAALAGMLVAALLVEVVRRRFGVPLQLQGATLGWPVAAALVLGILFSHWPARLAARISPSEALRNE